MHSVLLSLQQHTRTYPESDALTKWRALEHTRACQERKTQCTRTRTHPHKHTRTCANTHTHTHTHARARARAVRSMPVCQPAGQRDTSSAVDDEVAKINDAIARYDAQSSDLFARWGAATGTSKEALLGSCTAARMKSVELRAEKNRLLAARDSRTSSVSHRSTHAVTVSPPAAASSGKWCHPVATYFGHYVVPLIVQHIRSLLHRSTEI
jgi:hypothetical protein